MAPRRSARLAGQACSQTGAKLGSRPAGFKRKLDRGRAALGSALLALVDLLDDLGHVVLVLAELGGVLQDLFLLLAHLLLGQLDIGHLGLDGRRFLWGGRRPAAAWRLAGLGLIDCLALRADDRI